MSIELTAKRWKVIKVIGASIFLLGAAIVVWGIAPMLHDKPYPPGTVKLWIGGNFTGVGIATVSASDMLAWWHHG